MRVGRGVTSSKSEVNIRKGLRRQGERRKSAGVNKAAGKGLGGCECSQPSRRECWQGWGGEVASRDQRGEDLVNLIGGEDVGR